MPAHTGSFSGPLPPGLFFPLSPRLRPKGSARSRTGFVALAALVGVMAGLVFATVLVRQLDPVASMPRNFSITVPARVVANFFIVESRAVGGEVQFFVIDTGSSTTLVSPEFAARYANPAGTSALVEVQGPTGQVVAKKRVVVPRLDLGRAQFAQVSAVVSDLSEISRHVGVPIAGIVGFPVFEHYLVTLDYGRRVLKVGLASPEGDVSNRGLVFPLRGDGRVPSVMLQVGGQASEVLIDSGSDGGVNLNPEHLQLRLRGPAREGALVATVAGNRRQYLGRIAHELEIGGVRIVDPVVDFTLGTPSVGGELLKNFALTFDQRRREVTFRRVTTGPIKLEARRSVGVSFARDDGAWQVAGLVPASGAAELPLQAGDRCVRINGETVDRWPAERYAALLDRAERVTFTFARGEQQTDLHLPVISLLE